MSDQIVKRLTELQKLLSDEELAKEGFKFFKSKTPVLTGNARRKTTLNKDSIEANYPYAQRLEEGYSSQAPKGMTEPTLEKVREYVLKTLGIKI